MKRGCFIFALLLMFLLVVPFSMAAMDFEKTAVNSVVIKELQRPAVFNFTIKNNLGIADFYSINSQLDFSIEPQGTFKIDASSEKNLLVKVYFSEQMKKQYAGSRYFEYFIKSQQIGLQNDNFEINVASFRDVIGVLMPESMEMTDKNISIAIKNKESASLDGTVSIDSALFKKSGVITLSPLEEKIIAIDLKKEDIWKEAGRYPVIISLTVDDYTLIIEKSTELKEHREILTTDKKLNLVAYQSRHVKKTNAGNVKETASIAINLSSFAKAFTRFNIQPSSTNKVGDVFVLEWSKELRPKEELDVFASTNYSAPLIVLAILAVLVLIIGYYKKSAFRVRKKVIKVMTKSGEFATKVVLFVTNRGKDADNITITDYLPLVAKLHERFGGDKPNTIEKNRLIWKMDTLFHGEQKIFSYIIYTELKFIGTLVIPQATANYSIDGKLKSVTSNRVHVIA